MIRHVILLFFLFQIANGNAATGSDYWKNCPGPACPAREHESAYKYEKGTEDDARMDHLKMHKERESHEKAIKQIEKEERRLEISR